MCDRLNRRNVPPLIKRHNEIHRMGNLDTWHSHVTLRNWGIRGSFGVKISYQRGGEPCPRWTPRQIGYGRSFSCSFWWQRYPHTVQRPPRWAAQWRSRANHPQILSYTLEGDPSWLEAEGLSNMEKERKETKLFQLKVQLPYQLHTAKIQLQEIHRKHSDYSS